MQVPLIDAILYAVNGFLGLAALLCCIVVLARIYKHGETRLAIILGVSCFALVGCFLTFLAGVRRANRLRLENVLCIWVVCFLLGLSFSVVRLYLIAEQRLTERYHRQQVARQLADLGTVLHGDAPANRPASTRPPLVWQTLLWPYGSSRRDDPSVEPVVQLPDADLANAIRGEWRMEFRVRDEFQARLMPYVCPPSPDAKDGTSNTLLAEKLRNEANAPPQTVVYDYEGVLKLQQAGLAEFTGNCKGVGDPQTVRWKGVHNLTGRTLRLSSIPDIGMFRIPYLDRDPSPQLLDMPLQEFQVEDLRKDALTLRDLKGQEIRCRRVR